MTHGTFASHTHGCRCRPCTNANREHYNDGIRWRRTRIKPGGKLCQICGQNIFEHPLRACWREAR